MAFITKPDFSNNRQVKQFKETITQLSGTTVFGIADELIPLNLSADTINIDALQNIRTRGIILPDQLTTFTGTSYQVLGRNNDTGKVVGLEITGGSGNGVYINEDVVPITVGGFEGGLPATDEQGLTDKEFKDKLLFPSIAPNIEDFVATPQPEYNEPAPYDVDVSWDITVNTVGAGIGTFRLEWKRSNESTWNTLTTNSNLSNFTHTLNSVNNNNINYRIFVEDTSGASQTATITRTVQNYQEPDGFIITQPSGSLIERGRLLGTTSDTRVVKNRQYALLTGAALFKRFNDKEDGSGTWSSWNPLSGFAGTDIPSPLNFTQTNTNNYNSQNEALVQYKIEVDDTGESNQNVVANKEVKKILPYFWGVDENAVTPSQFYIESGNKVVQESTDTININFNASSQYLWFAIPEDSASKTEWLVTQLNSGDIGGPTNLFNDPTTITVSSPTSGIFWEKNYKFYYSNYPTTVNTPMQLNN
jgi:hypothetical protein